MVSFTSKGLPCNFREHEVRRDGIWTKVIAGIPGKRKLGQKWNEKPMKTQFNDTETEMLPEYDFRGKKGVRGKY